MGQGSSQPAHLQNPDLEQESDHDTDMHSTKSDASPPPPVNKPNRESRPPNGSLPKRKRAPSQSVTSPVAATTPEDRPSALKRKRVVDNLGKEKTPAPNGQRSSSQKTRVNQSSAGPGPGLFSKEISAGRLNRALSAAANGGSPARSTVSEGPNKGRLHRSNGEAGKNGLTGAFKPDEVEALEEFKVRFCNSYGLSTTTFDLIVQHGKGPFPGPPGVTKYTFWQEVHSILPNRDKRSVRRFMKRHFQASSQKPHEWTEEQEDELVVLYRQNGPKWAYISELLGRSSDDVVQRWKNRLEHRSTMNVGPWSEDELSLLKEVLRDAWSKMQKQGYDVGSNIYEMDESLISWGQVSIRMKHTRSRQQCADKWRRVKGSRVAQGSRENSRANSQSLSRSATPLQAKREAHRARKSAAYVVSDEDSDAGDNAVNEKDATDHSKRGTPASKTLNKPKKIESKEAESGSSSESDSESESETTSKSGSATLNKKPNSSEKKASSPERKQLSSTSSEESDSSSESDSDSDSDSGSAGNNKTTSTLQKHEESKAADVSKREASSDESDDSSSEEESESDSENESPDEIPATPSPEPTTEETLKGAKRRRSNSATTEAAEAGDKRVKVKKERSPTPSAVVAPEHEQESESREQDAKILKRESTAESETSSESESESNEQDAKKREGSRESETSSDSDAESDSSESSAGDEAERENSPTKRHPEPEDVEMKQNSLSDYEVSSDSDADSTSSSDSEDEPSKDGPDVTVKTEPADTAPAIKKENDSDSSSDSTSSSGSSSDSDSDSDSDSE